MIELEFVRMIPEIYQNIFLLILSCTSYILSSKSFEFSVVTGMAYIFTLLWLFVYSYLSCFHPPNFIYHFFCLWKLYSFFKRWFKRYLLHDISLIQTKLSFFCDPPKSPHTLIKYLYSYKSAICQIFTSSKKEAMSYLSLCQPYSVKFYKDHSFL